MEGTRTGTNKVDLLHKELSYMIQGIVFAIREDFGLEHKEQIYQRAFELALVERNIPFQREPAIKIFAPRSGDFVGLYRPDFLVDGKVIVELKAQKFLPSSQIRQIYDYLRNSKYELGYLVNFAPPRAYIKRILYTNDRKYWYKKLFVIVSLLFVFVRGLPAQAATFSFGASAPEVGIGAPFEVGVFLDTERERINAVEGTVTFPGDALTVREIRDPGSIVTFWVERPTLRGAEVVFSGITPGGYTGDRGELFSIVFEPRSVGAVTLATSGERALRNDGAGSAAPVRRAPLHLTVTDRVRAPGFLPTYDAEPPDPFTVTIVRDPNLVDGKWVAVFATRDAGSGVDHYEVQEYARRGATLEEWVPVESPYVLTDQQRRSFLSVKAVDRARNERVVVVAPQYPQRFLDRTAVRAFAAAVALILIAGIVWSRRRVWRAP